MKIGEISSAIIIFIIIILITCVNRSVCQDVSVRVKQGTIVGVSVCD